MRVKKGAIDPVTDVDVAVETMFRKNGGRAALDPVLAEFGGDAAGRAARAGCSIRSTAPPTSPTLPIFCSSLALEIDGVAEVAAIYDPNRRELFTRARRRRVSERPAAAVGASALVDAMLVTGFPHVHSRIAEIVGLFGESRGRVHPVAPGSAAIDLCYVAAGRDGFGKATSLWDYGRRVDRGRGRRPHHQHGR